MTSEIRANTLKNRVGLGTVSFTNTGPVVSGIVTATSFATDGGHMYITNAMPALYLTDTNNNPDWRIQNVNGTLSFIDATNSVHRIEINTVGNVSLSNDLDVDGHTNLDNVSIAGVTTVTGSIIVDDPGGGTGLSMNGVSGQTCGVVRQKNDMQHAIIFRGSSNADGSTITGGNTMEYREYGDHVFKTGAINQGERLRITQAGKVGLNQSGPYADVDITSSVEDADNGTLAAHGIRLAHVGATDEEVIPITASFRTQQDRARAGIGFISKQSSGIDGLAGAIGFYTRNTADGNGLYRTDERVRIAEDGKVGIGTDDPSHKIDISGDGVAFPSAAGSTLLRLRSSAGTATLSIDAAAGSFSAIQFGDTAAASVGSILYNHLDDSMKFNTGGTGTKLFINSAGEVGISVSPASGHLLHIKNAGTAEAKVKIESESGYDARLILDTSNGGGAGAHIDFQIDGTAKGGIQYVTNGSASDQHDIIFRSNNYSEKLRIDSAGRCIVGGGTHAGGSALVVKGGNQNTYSTIGMFSNHTNPANNTLLSQIRFGANATAVGADIRVYADADWGNNDYPTRMEFHTAPDGSNSRQVRLKIENDGDIKACYNGGAFGVGGDPINKFGITSTGNDFFGLHRSNASTGTGEFSINVETNSQVTFSMDDEGAFSFGTSSDPSAQSGYVEKLRLDTSGRLGLHHNLSGAADYNRLMIYNPHSGSCWLQMMSTATGSGANTDGLSMGLNTSNTAHFWLRENSNMVFATNGTSRMDISSGGIITKPYQVAWCMHGTTTQTITGGTRLAFNANGTGFGSFSNRNHSGVNTSNHSFTVPVTGLYSITVTVFFYTDNNTSTCSLVPFKNDVAMSNGNDTIFILGASAVNANVTYSGTVLLQLNANDKIDIRRRTGEGGNSRVYLPHSYFAGFLVG